MAWNAPPQWWQGWAEVLLVRRIIIVRLSMAETVSHLRGNCHDDHFEEKLWLVSHVSVAVVVARIRFQLASPQHYGDEPGKAVCCKF